MNQSHPAAAIKLRNSKSLLSVLHCCLLCVGVRKWQVYIHSLLPRCPTIFSLARRLPSVWPCRPMWSYVRVGLSVVVHPSHMAEVWQTMCPHNFYYILVKWQFFHYVYVSPVIPFCACQDFPHNRHLENPEWSFMLLPPESKFQHCTTVWTELNGTDFIKHTCSWRAEYMNGLDQAAIHQNFWELLFLSLYWCTWPSNFFSIFLAIPAAMPVLDVMFLLQEPSQQTVPPRYINLSTWFGSPLPSLMCICICERSLPTVSVYLHLNFSGRLRKNILFLQEWRFGRSRSFKMYHFGGANRKRVYDFLLVSHCNLGPILHRFGDTVGFLCSWVTTPPFHPNFRGVPVAPDGPCWGQPEQKP